MSSIVHRMFGQRSIALWMIGVSMFCGVMAANAGVASGTLTVNGKEFTLTHAYGLQVEDWTDKSKMGTLLILSDRPVPEKVLQGDVSIFDLKDAGVNGLKLEFYSGGENYAMMLVGAGAEGSVSVSGTFDSSQFTTYEPTKIGGKISAEEKEVGDTKYAYEVTFDADVMPRKEKVMPTAEETKAAQSAASAKAYVAFNQAVRDGNLDLIRVGVVPERAEQMNNPQFKEMLGLIQSMMPSDIRVLKATETGDSAELVLTGKDDGKDKEGVATLRKVGGKWLVEGESWK